MIERLQQFPMASVHSPTIRFPLDPPLSSSAVSSPRIRNLMQRRTEYATEREFEIEASKDHWSELESKVSMAVHAHADNTNSKKQQFHILALFRRTLGRLLFCWHCGNCGAFICGVLSCGAIVKSEHPQQGNAQECVELEEGEDSDAEESNRDIFESIKSQWGGFFSAKWGDNLELGPKIAEGGQAEIFEVEGGIDAIRMEFVVKAFKKGYSLRSLQSQWPLGTPNGHFNLINSAIIFAGTVLKDDRFAFVMYKHWGDLRKLIDLTMQERNNHGPPFQEHQAVSIMLQIASGMEQLHKKNILHRDLKASNVLIAFDRKKTRNPSSESEFSCAIADYECSVGVVGTGFWRAPEVLAAVRDTNSRNGRNSSSFSSKADVSSSFASKADVSNFFSSKTDVYSFAMTCFEVLTGCVPFENRLPNDCDDILRGLRPQLPHPMNSRLTELLCQCWHSNPAERPSFPDIVLALETVKRSLDVANPNSLRSSHKSP